MALTTFTRRWNRGLRTVRLSRKRRECVSSGLFPWLLVSGVLAVVPVGGCGTHCNDIGCTDGVIVQLRQGLAVDGVLDIDVTEDGTSRRCTLSTTSDTCEAMGVQVRRDAADHLAGLELAHRFPEEISISIVKNGDALVDETFAPVYESEAPPDPNACVESCRVAYHEL